MHLFTINPAFQKDAERAKTLVRFVQDFFRNLAVASTVRFLAVRSGSELLHGISFLLYLLLCLNIYLILFPIETEFFKGLEDWKYRTINLVVTSLLMLMLLYPINTAIDIAVASGSAAQANPAAK